jgi:hypothetical protein
MASRFKKCAVQVLVALVEIVVGITAIVLILSVIPENNGKACESGIKHCYTGENVPRG